MAGRIDGKIAIVTGAGSGLGQATAELFAREGARVAVTDLNDDAASETANRINAAHTGAAIALHHDVTSQDDWRDVTNHVDKTFGGLDILVNNAGISLHGDTETTDYAQFQKLINIDLDSVFLGCQAAIPVMRDSGGGSIVNISSVAALLANPNTVGYGTAKAGVAYITKCVALDCAKKGYNIRCNSIHPTYIRTPMAEQFIHSEEDRDRMNRMVPIGRICELDDVTYPILFLASKEAAMMTGAELVVDGGLSAGYMPRIE